MTHTPSGFFLLLYCAHFLVVILSYIFSCVRFDSLTLFPQIKKTFARVACLLFEICCIDNKLPKTITNNVFSLHFAKFKTEICICVFATHSFDTVIARFSPCIFYHIQHVRLDFPSINIDGLKGGQMDIGDKKAIAGWYYGVICASLNWIQCFFFACVTARAQPSSHSNNSSSTNKK